MMDEVDLLSDLDQLRSRYEILRRLTLDGRAPVYAVRSRETEQHFVVKVMADRATRGMAPGKLHAWQAHNIASLDYPKLMAMHAVHHLQGGAVAVAMERRRGKSLAERLRDDGRLTIESVEAIVRDVGEALAYLHSRGVVHRHVCPETIFLDRDARVARLAFFGVDVAPAPSFDASRGSFGSADAAHRYLAPEQLKGGEVVDGRHVSAATDVFSLGLTAFELLTGSHPADAGAAENSWRKRLVGRIDELRPDAPEQLLAAIDQSLEPNPGRRLASGAAFLARLDSTDDRPDDRVRSVAGPLDPPATILRRVIAGSTQLVMKAGSGIREARLAAMKRLSPPAPSGTSEPPDTDIADPSPEASTTIRDRHPLRGLAIPAGAALLAVSTVVAVRQLTSDPTAANYPSSAEPSIVDENEDAESETVETKRERAAYLDILDKAEASSYRIPLQPPSPSRMTAEPSSTRTASLERTTADEPPSEDSTDIPETRLADEPRSAGGLVLLGDPIRR